MSAGTSELFCLMICFLLCFSEAQTNITADLGQDVTLPCKVPNNEILIRAVEWSRPDQDPDYVLFYRDGHLHPESQHPSYQNRVDLQDKEMKDGDISLVLRNVMMEDNGRYECYVLQGETTSKTVYLEVYPSGDMVGIIVGSAVVVILLLAVASLGFLIYRRHMMKNQDVSVPPDEAAAKQIL